MLHSYKYFQLWKS